MLQAGRLRFKLWIKNPDPTARVTSAAGVQESLQSDGYIWADLEELSASERYQSGVPLGTAIYKITCRWTADITRHSELWIEDPPGSYRRFSVVTAIDPQCRRKELSITAEELI